MKYGTVLAIAVASVALTMNQASATVISRTYDLTAVDFIGDGSPPAVDPFHLVFSVTFDNSIDYRHESNEFNVLFYSFSNISHPLVFGYKSSNDLLTVAPLSTAGGGCGLYVNTACAQIDGATSASPSISVVDQVVGLDRRDGDPFYRYFTHSGTITYVDNPLPDPGLDAAVPEPAIWTMMLVGFGAIGFAMRRERALPQVRFAF